MGGYPIPEVNSFINAFRVGVREMSPDAKFLVGFLGTWFDPAKAKETGLAQIDAGADLLLGERIGTVDAAAERGKLAVGSITDFRPKYPKTVYANVYGSSARRSTLRSRTPGRQAHRARLCRIQPDGSWRQ